MLRKTVKSGTLWESKVGYSRAIRVGSHIFVSGTTATDNALRKLDADLNDLYIRKCMLLILREIGKK